MPRDYNPDDGGYYGAMSVADIFADGIRQTIEERKAAEKQNLGVLANQQDNELRAKEMELRREMLATELGQRKELQTAELGLRREELNNRMATSAAELEIRRQQVAADKMRLEASALGTRTQRARAEAMLNNSRMAAGLLGVTAEEGATVENYGEEYEGADVSDPASKALTDLNASVAAGMRGEPMPGEPVVAPTVIPGAAQPAANDPELPDSPGGLLDPGALVGPAAGAEGVTGAAGPAALPGLPAPPEEDADYRLKLRKLLAMQKLAKDPNTPIDYQIKLEEEAMRIQNDPAFAMQVKNHAARIRLAEDRQNLPTSIFASPVDKQMAFSATYPHLKFAITAPGQEVPQMLRPDGTAIPDAEFKVIKSAWDQFEYKPGMLIPRTGSGTTPFGPPVVPVAAAVGAAAVVAPPGIGLLTDPVKAEAARFWTEGKEQAARLARLGDATNEELAAITSGLNPDEPGEINFPPFKDGKTYREILAGRIAAEFQMPAGADRPAVRGRSGEVSPEDFLRAAAADELNRRGAGQGPTLSPEKRAAAEAIFQ